uniref:Uncharacterized protein n=1 Tax=Solanum lycopersicum TaxID=4081 RepID=A0A3Q7HJQ1_SOLLC
MESLHGLPKDECLDRKGTFSHALHGPLISIPIEDQQKTTFTCPYKTFAFKHMPFGLCDAFVIFLCFMVLIFINVVEDIIE